MKPGRYKVNAIILDRLNYGEADLIVSFFSREFGKIKGMAKHGRKSRQRFGNVLTPSAVVELEFTHKMGRDLVRMESGVLLRSFEALPAEPGLFGRALMALELMDAFGQPHDPEPEMFDLLAWTLDRLNSGQRAEELLTIYQLKLLALAGFGPNLISCSHCDETIGPERHWSLHMDTGGLACRRCAPGGFPVSLGTIKAMVLIRSLPFDKINRVRLNSLASAEAGSFLLAYIRHILGRDLKTSRFLEKLSTPNY